MWAVALPLFLTVTAQAQDSTVRRQSPLGKLGGFLEKVIQSNTATTGNSLSPTDIATGLKEALRVGIDKGSTQASALRSALRPARAALRLALGGLSFESPLRYVVRGPSPEAARQACH